MSSVGTKTLSFVLQLCLQPPSLLSSPISTGLLLLDNRGCSSEALLKKQKQLLTSARSRVLPELEVSSSTICTALPPASDIPAASLEKSPFPSPNVPVHVTFFLFHVIYILDKACPSDNTSLWCTVPVFLWLSLSCILLQPPNSKSVLSHVQ